MQLTVMTVKTSDKAKHNHMSTDEERATLQIFWNTASFMLNIKESKYVKILSRLLS